MTRAVILGGAACVWSDLARLRRLCGGSWPGIVVTVNDAHVAYCGRVDHFVTQHAEQVNVWKRHRAEAGGNADYRTWGCKWPTRKHDPHLENVDEAIAPWGSGSSGLHAVTVCRVALGIDRVVLCGVPMTKTPHFPGALLADSGDWKWAENHQDRWTSRLHLMEPWVRSMSGWTKGLLGAPTRDWLRVPAWDGGGRAWVGAA